MYRNEPWVSRAVNILGLKAELYLTDNIDTQMQKYQSIHNNSHNPKRALHIPHNQDHINTFNYFQPR